MKVYVDNRHGTNDVTQVRAWLPSVGKGASLNVLKPCSSKNVIEPPSSATITFDDSKELDMLIEALLTLQKNIKEAYGIPFPLYHEN